MQEVGNDMHWNARKFAIEIQNTAAKDDMRPALIALSNTTKACIARIDGFRLK